MIADTLTVGSVERHERNSVFECFSRRPSGNETEALDRKHRVIEAFALSLGVGQRKVSSSPFSIRT